MLLTREQILSKGGPLTEQVEIPEWGGTVAVRGMTGRERDEWEASMMVMKHNRMIPAPANARAKMIVRCAVDEAGEPIFTYGDIEKLGDLSAAPLQRLYDVAARLSGVTAEDQAELEENFGQTPGEPDSSPSPNGSTAPSG